MMVVLILDERDGREEDDRTFTPEQKTEIALAGLRGDRSVRDICLE
jgi:hypothetical protein